MALVPETTPSEPRVAAPYDVSSPPLSFSRRLQIPLISAGAQTVVRLLGPTLRFDVLGWQHVERVHAGGSRCIYSFWHRAIFLAAWWWRDQGVVAMTSANFDGQWLGRTLEGLGYGSTPGSSSRGGLRGLAVLARKIQEGRDATFAADGPRGPRYIAKIGHVLLARRTGCPVIPLHLHAERAHVFAKAWDLTQLPHPFSRVALAIAPPLEVPAGASREEVEHKHAELQNRLERARATAEAWFTLSAEERQRERSLWNA